LICEAYTNLGPRPTKAHRVCIYFAVDESKLRLVLVPMIPGSVAEDEAAQALVAPVTKRIDWSAGIGFDTDCEDYRDIHLCYASGCNFLPFPRNQSLGLATGEPMSSMKGPLLVCVAQFIGADVKADPGDEADPSEKADPSEEAGPDNEDDSDPGDEAYPDDFNMGDAMPHDLPALLKHFTRAGSIQSADRTRSLLAMMGLKI
jgi:hypothetical protein